MSFLGNRLNRRAFSRHVPEPERLPERERSGERPRPGIPNLVPTALWFGLVAGLLETSVRLGQQLWDNRVTVESIRTNRHWIWMVPVSDVLIFGVCGLLLGFAVRKSPRFVGRVAPYLICTLAFLGPLLAIRGLYALACLVLAGGLATRTVPLIEAHADRFRLLVRRSNPWLLGIVALLTVLAGGREVLAERRALAGLPPARAGAPNVLLIVMDDVRADDLSLYGYHRETTPNLARWARRGIRFDHARSTAPWTLPSHASMLTGRWPHQLSTRVDRPLDSTFPTLAEFLAQRGYATAGLVGNTYYCNAWYGLDRGFSHYEDFPENRRVSGLETLRSSTLGHRIVELTGIETATPGAKGSRKTAAMINRDALAWLARKGDRPYFLFLNYYDAHAPFQVPDGFDTHFGLDAEPLAVRKTILRNYARLTNRQDASGDVDVVETSAQVHKAAELFRDSYDSCIAYLDDQLGRLFAELQARGLLDNTLVIVTSDHGEHFGERHLFGHGNSLYRPLIHVPLVIIPPGDVSTALTVRDPVSLRNLPATVADLLGVRDTSPFPGQSLARYWEPGPSIARAKDDPPLSEVEHQVKFAPSPHIPASLGPLQAIAAEDRVYIRNSDGREELYDLEGDPDEIRNLAGAAEAAPVLERLRHRLMRLFE